MRLPTGRLVRSRVVSDVRTALVDALDRRLTGYAVLAGQDTLLLSDDGTGVLTFERGVPVLAYHTGTDRGGPPALADLAVPGPYRLELHELDDPRLEEANDTPELRVPPGMPAERLAGDPALAERTRRAAPADRRAGSDAEGDRDADGDRGGDERLGAVEAFLEDEQKIEAIRERARAEAEARAAEWGFDLADDRTASE